MNPEYVAIIKEECEKNNIDPKLFCAIVNTESAWDPMAVRFENGFVYFWKAKDYAEKEKITVETETVLQKISFGLCQIMGANARSMDYDEPLMTLTDPRKNIEVGVKFFKKRCDKYPDINDKIASYNAGTPKKFGDRYSNQAYVDKVHSFYLSLPNRI